MTVTLEYCLGLTLTPTPEPQIYLGAPKILKPVLDTRFQGLLLGKVWTTCPRSWVTTLGVGAPNFNGGRPQILDSISKFTPYIRPSEL